MAVPLFFPANCNKKIKTRRLLEQLSNFEVRQTCGVPICVARQLVDLYEPLAGKISTAIPLETKVLLFLSQLRTGSFQKICGSSTNVSQPSASRIIEACCNHTLSFSSSCISFPDTIADLNSVKHNFHRIAGIQGVIGVLDGTHVAIKAPSVHEQSYVNRKSFHSINCQIIADTTYKIFDIVAKWPGSTHDSFIWRNSAVRNRLNNEEFGNSYILADSGYGAEPRLRVPIRNPATEADHLFNSDLRNTRSVVERAIGNWKSRFRCMDRTGGSLCYDPLKSCKLIVSSVVLNNIFISNNIPILEEDGHYLENELLPVLEEQEDN